MHTMDVFGFNLLGTTQFKCQCVISNTHLETNMADYAVFFSGSAKEKYPLEFSISLHTRAWYSNQQIVKRTLIHIMIYMVYNMVLWYMYMKVYKEISE